MIVLDLTTFVFLSSIIVVKNVLSARTPRETGDAKSDVDATTLRLVHILHRHGDRSQISTYKNDIYNESSWPQGYGQLSKVGMTQTHDLGVYLRHRYIDTGFLNPEYKRTQLYVRSTDMDRTLMSAYCVLSGLFPPDNNQTWNPDIAWQPIPVHTIPRDMDDLLHVNSEEYKKQVASAHATNPKVKEIMDKYKEEYKYISDNSGERNSWAGIKKVLDPLFCQYSSNFTLPDWVNNHTLEIVLKLRDLYTEAYRMNATRYAYLLFGPLLGEIIDHMVNVSTGENTLSTKFFHYSAHDTNVEGLLTTMGLFNDRQPPYRSCVIIELHEPQKSHFVVKILFRNESDHDPYPLKLKYCDYLCPLDTFRQIMNSSIPEDNDTEFGNSCPDTLMNQLTKSGPVAVIAGVLTILLLVCVVIGAFLCCYHRNKLREAHDYAPVPIEMS